jgi:hypothetical protein
MHANSALIDLCVGIRHHAFESAGKVTVDTHAGTGGSNAGTVLYVRTGIDHIVKWCAGRWGKPQQHPVPGDLLKVMPVT